MPDTFHTDWGTAIATIVGAIIGVLGTLFVEYFRAERRRIRFIVLQPEDLAKALRSHGSSFEVKINNVSTQTLIAAGIAVQNFGNVIINDLKFDIIIPGLQNIMQVQAISDNPKLASAVGISFYARRTAN